MMNRTDPEILSAADFERRIAQLNAARGEKRAAINRFPKIVATAGGAVMVLAAASDLLFSFSCKTETLFAMPWAVTLAGGILVLIAALLLPPLVRALTVSILAAGYLAWFFAGFGQRLLAALFGYSGLPEDVLGVAALTGTILLSFGSARALGFFPSSRFARVTAFAAGFPGFVAAGVMFVLLVKIALMQSETGPLHGATLFGYIVLAALLLAVFTMHFAGVRAFKASGRHEVLRNARAAVIAGGAAAALLPAFMLILFVKKAILFNSPTPVLFVIANTVFPIFAPAAIAVAGFTDLMQQVALREWSARVDVELSRMEQELEASSEE